MKTALITGVCLLALTFTITDALDKKQDECQNPSDDVKACAIALFNDDADSFCKLNCKFILTSHYENCEVDINVDAINQKYNVFCVATNSSSVHRPIGEGDGPGVGSRGNGGNDGGDTGSIGGGPSGDGGEGDGNRGSSAATLGVTLFTVIVSAVMIAVEN